MGGLVAVVGYVRNVMMAEWKYHGAWTLDGRCGGLISTDLSIPEGALPLYWMCEALLLFGRMRAAFKSEKVISGLTLMRCKRK